MILGYLEDSPAPPTLQIYDCVHDTFSPTYTPPQHPISLPPASSSVPSPSSNSGPSSSTTPSANPSNTPVPPDGIPGNGNHIGAAIGATLGILALVLLGVGARYYLRRRRSLTRANNRFVALGQDDDGRNSPHFEGGPVAVSWDNERYRNRRSRWDSGFLTSLSGVIGGVALSNKFSNVPERRDILADEDTREFDRWYAQSRRGDRISGSSWSLRSIIGQRVETWEPSMSSSLGMATRREKTDSSADTSMLVGDHAIYPMTPQVRLPKSRDMVYPKYIDPFADPVETQFDHRMDKDETMAGSEQPYLHPLPRPFTTVQTILPTFQAEQALSTLREHASQQTLSTYEHPQSDSSHTSNHHTLVSDGSRSQLLSPPTGAVVSSSIMEIRPLGQLVRRSDSWWARFSRTSFLDRRPSNVSRVSGGMSEFEFRDPKPPPVLIAIDESTPIEDPVRPRLVPRALSAVYEQHNKSKTSVGTADTEAIERIAGMADVQIMRSGSQRTASSYYTRNSLHTRSSSRFQDLGQTEDTNPDPSSAPEIASWQSPFHSPTDESDGNPNLSGFPRDYPSPILSHGGSPTIDPQHDPTAPSPSVATRIHDLGRRASHAHGPLPLTNTRHWEEKVKQPGVSMTYGLIPRPSLFVANPDHTRTPSADS